MDKSKGTLASQKKSNPPRRDWSQEAACRGLPGFDSPVTKKDKEKNRAICLECPVLDLCLEYSLAYSDEEGFWAGMTATERRTLRRTLPRKALTLVSFESHSSFEFAPALSVNNPPPVRVLPKVDLDLVLDYLL